MSKLVQALLVGFLITLILDGLMFMGMLVNYINYYEINLFYKPFFANNQNIYLFSFLSIIFGFIVTYINNDKFSAISIGILFSLSLSTFITPIGKSLGEKLFMTKDVTLRDSKYTYNGNIYYNGKTQIIFFDKDVEKIIIIDKKDLI
ncbi:MAG: hypothetical protein K8R44_07465 [Sulfurimonas sp.]|nr:hypothetical protein [Sulfurimonas sp.]